MPTPEAFFSYVRRDDERERGNLTELRKHLSTEVEMQTGEDFLIFQDREDILWGQRWQDRIERTLDATTFLIPVIRHLFSAAQVAERRLRNF